ncbi:unnamed protein product [Caenorhabditis auriculariae]|uniref:Uncharacterized protein n=1 Tax=Caenorhabditis auriculariae TaxID=2777116 RepID=A0A8S1GNH6_9PELO|nr:unnamed protein product [Caenorhabditis auriculariae]
MSSAPKLFLNTDFSTLTQLLLAFISIFMTPLMIGNCAKKRNHAVNMDDEEMANDEEGANKRKNAGYEDRLKKPNNIRSKLKNDFWQAISEISDRPHHTPPPNSAVPARSVLRTACPIHGAFSTAKTGAQETRELTENEANDCFWSEGNLEDTQLTQCPSTEEWNVMKETDPAKCSNAEREESEEVEVDRCTCTKNKKSVHFAK